jgi:hypothetical protein
MLDSARDIPSLENSDHIKENNPPHTALGVNSEDLDLVRAFRVDSNLLSGKFTQ